MVHNIKIKEPYADAIISGEKTFEIRYNDRGYQKGDRIIFQCTDGYLTINHEINYKIYEITYLIHGFGLKDDWCVFSIKEVTGKE